MGDKETWGEGGGRKRRGEKEARWLNGLNEWLNDFQGPRFKVEII